MFVEHIPFLKNSRHVKLLAQIERFGITGGTSFVLDCCLLIALTELAGLNYLVSATISFSISVVYVYLLSIFWVFDFSSGKMTRLSASVPFIILAVLGLGLNNAVLYVGVEFLAVHYAVCKVFATAVVMVFNFITRKMLLEGKRNHVSCAEQPVASSLKQLHG